MFSSGLDVECAGLRAYVVAIEVLGLGLETLSRAACQTKR